MGKKDKDEPSSQLVRSNSGVLVDAKYDMRKQFKECQKNITPPVADAARGFYESLLKENSDSVIAIKYIIENGVLQADEHKKVLKKYIKLRDAGAFDPKKVAIARAN